MLETTPPAISKYWTGLEASDKTSSPTLAVCTRPSVVTENKNIALVQTSKLHVLSRLENPPTDLSTILERPNPAIDVSNVLKMRRSTDYETKASVILL